jgi:asparagine synthase (glutamine-hydrolysing)
VCGITGFCAPSGGLTGDTARERLATMTRCIAHRGPDDEGLWTDVSAGVGLGQRRLAVVDLSATGAQPMHSASGRHVIVYNGECYELEALRRDVERQGPALRGTSDTEVVLEACERLGLEATLHRLIGMFAFALYDREARVLHLVRDRLGIKPLYVADDGRRVHFSSESRALQALGDVVGGVDPDSVAAFLGHGVLPAGRSIHRGVRQLRPGTLLSVHADGTREERTWWSLPSLVAASTDARARGGTRTAGEVVEEMAGLLRRAVGARMVADVPLGAFLSGGVDSSSVVALMQEQTSRPVRTFTVGSTDPAYDESGFAAAVARHLGTEHTDVRLSDDEIVELIPDLLAGLDEPFADPSYVPTWLVSRLARPHVTVALSGDGGDEVFGGYTRHRLAAGRAGRLLGLPLPVKLALAGLLGGVPPRAWDVAAGLIPASRRPGRAGEQAQKVARTLGARDLDELYRRLTAVWSNPAAMVLGASEADVTNWGAAASPLVAGLAGLSAPERMMLADTLGYLPDDVLTKVDRASMAVSLEARVPLLDHRVVEAAWRLPLDLRIRGGVGKWVLRQVLARHLPDHLFDRPKRGFAQPVGRWLRGPLRPWAEDLLAPAALAGVGLLAPAPVQRLWREHLSGRHDHHAQLWAVLSLQSWSSEAQRAASSSV